MSRKAKQTLAASLPSSFPWRLLCELAAYRAPASITEYILLESTDESSRYYICPRCRISLEREFQSCCDRCGQCLDWKHYRKAKRRIQQQG